MSCRRGGTEEGVARHERRPAGGTLVIQIKGESYARAFGVNYVYLLWALAYESVFVVFAPVYLAELIFRRRRDGLWLDKKGLAVVVVAFFAGEFPRLVRLDADRTAESFPRSNLQSAACDRGDRRDCHRRADLRRDWPFSGPTGAVGTSAEAAGTWVDCSGGLRVGDAVVRVGRACVRHCAGISSRRLQ